MKDQDQKDVYGASMTERENMKEDNGREQFGVTTTVRERRSMVKPMERKSGRKAKR